MEKRTTPSEKPEKLANVSKLSLLIPKNPDGSSRVVRKMIFIDPEKLQKVGLDKKIAEAIKNIEKGDSVGQFLEKNNQSKSETTTEIDKKQEENPSTKPKLPQTTALVTKQSTQIKSGKSTDSIEYKTNNDKKKCSLALSLESNLQIDSSPEDDQIKSTEKSQSSEVKKSLSLSSQTQISYNRSKQEKKSKEKAFPDNFHNKEKTMKASLESSEEISDTLIFNIVKSNPENGTVDVKIFKDNLCQMPEAVIPKANIDPTTSSEISDKTVMIATKKQTKLKVLEKKVLKEGEEKIGLKPMEICSPITPETPLVREIKTYERKSARRKTSNSSVDGINSISCSDDISSISLIDSCQNTKNCASTISLDSENHEIDFLCEDELKLNSNNANQMESTIRKCSSSKTEEEDALICDNTQPEEVNQESLSDFQDITECLSQKIDSAKLEKPSAISDCSELRTESECQEDHIASPSNLLMSNTIKEIEPTAGCVRKNTSESTIKQSKTENCNEEQSRTHEESIVQDENEKKIIEDTNKLDSSEHPEVKSSKASSISSLRLRRGKVNLIERRRQSKKPIINVDKTKKTTIDIALEEEDRAIVVLAAESSENKPSGDAEKDVSEESKENESLKISSLERISKCPGSLTSIIQSQTKVDAIMKSSIDENSETTSHAKLAKETEKCEENLNFPEIQNDENHGKSHQLNDPIDKIASEQETKNDQILDKTKKLSKQNEMFILEENKEHSDYNQESEELVPHEKRTPQKSMIDSLGDPKPESVVVPIAEQQLPSVFSKEKKNEFENSSPITKDEDRKSPSRNELPKRKRKYVRNEISAKVTAKKRVKKEIVSSPTPLSTDGEDFLGFEEKSTEDHQSESPACEMKTVGGETYLIFPEDIPISKIKTSLTSSEKDDFKDDASNLSISFPSSKSKNLDPEDKNCLTDEQAKSPIANVKTAGGGNATLSLKKRWEATHKKDLTFELDDKKLVSEEIVSVPEKKIKKRGRKPKNKIATRNNFENSETESSGTPKRTEITNQDKRIVENVDKLERGEMKPKDQGISGNIRESQRKGRRSKIKNEIENNFPKVERQTPVTEKKSGQISKEESTAVERNLENVETQNSETTKSVGRPKKKAKELQPNQKVFRKDADFNGRLLLARNRAQVDSDEPLTEQPEPPEGLATAKDLQCGMCLGFTSKSKWVHHISSHYGIGWICGQEPVNINSRSTVLSTILWFFKETKVKGLSCRMCQRLFRSALGILIHIESCGISDAEKLASRIKCEFCDMEYAKTTLVIHMRRCRMKMKQESEKSFTNPEEQPEAILNNAGRAKRVSLIKAENNLKQITETIENENAVEQTNFSPSEFIKFIPPLDLNVIKGTFSKDIEKFGKAFCIEKLCKFSESCIDKMLHHLSECKYISSPGYKCTKCKKFCDKSEKIVLQHIAKRHKPKNQDDFNPSSSDGEGGTSSSSASDHGDEENSLVVASKRDKKKSRSSTVPGYKSGYKSFPFKNESDAGQCRENMRFFIERNYSSSILFGNVTPTYTAMSDEIIDQYAGKHPFSMKFSYSDGKQMGMHPPGDSSHNVSDHKRLAKFETIYRNSEAIFFVGGPIKALAWAPLPNGEENESQQYLAIAYRKRIDKFYRVVGQKAIPILILIYKCNGKMLIKTEEEPNPTGIHYGIAIDDGPVHCLEFIPSGGFSEEINRLGLLAVGTAKTEIKIYSLPLNIVRNDDEKIQLIKLSPAFVLCLKMTELPKTTDPSPYDSHCTHLVWSQASGHTHIIGGYYNGFIAIWDIDDDDNFNKFVVKNVPHYVPVNYFYCRDKEITSLNAHYDTSGLRWICITTATRKILFFDIREMSNPILLSEDTAKNYINALHWPVIWENPTYALADILTNYGSCLVNISPIALSSSSVKTDQSLCGINDLDYNPWNNFHVYGTQNGDLIFIETRAIYLKPSRRTYNGKAISTLAIHRFDGAPIPKRTDKVSGENWEMYESDYEDKYGLIFCPIQKLTKSTNSASLSGKRVPPLNLLRYMRITKVRFNKNASNLVAVGYENGFLRVFKFKRIDLFSND